MAVYMIVVELQRGNMDDYLAGEKKASPEGESVLDKAV